MSGTQMMAHSALMMVRRALMMVRRALLVGLVALGAGCPEGQPVPTVTPAVSLPGGSFEMGYTGKACREPGSADEWCDPSSYMLRPVAVSPFNIDRHEVTNAQYRYCVARGACAEPAATGLPETPDYYHAATYAGHPVIFVTWAMAKQYCEFVGRRLPTEAEWEFVARTGPQKLRDGRVYPWGDDKPTDDCKRAITGLCGRKAPARVESRSRDRSAWGVMDLGGNVAEWVEDLFGEYAYCEGEQSLDAACSASPECIAQRCFENSKEPTPKAGCVLHCKDDETPYCLLEAREVLNPRTVRGGPDRSARGGSYADGICRATSYVRRHFDPEGARAWIGFRCAGDGGS